MVGRHRRPVPAGRRIRLLQPYRPAYINDLHSWAVRQYAMSGNMVGGFTSAIGFGWNEDVLKKKGLPPPKCWADLTDPKYKARSRPPTGPSGTTPSWPDWCS